MKEVDVAKLPLAVVQAYTQKYPTIWELCDKLYTSDLDWDRRHCYLPIAGALAVKSTLDLPLSAVYMVPALAAWRTCKEVYSFDPDLAEALYAQADDVQLPSDIIMQLPFLCLYIDSGKYRFFAHLEHDVNDGRYELRFARLMPDGTTRAYYLHLGDFTLSESIAAGVDEGLYQQQRAAQDAEFANLLANPGQRHGTEYSDVLNQEALGEMLQLVLYICADNADVRQDEENRKTYRQRENKPVTDKYREIRKWEAGAYVGNVLRKQGSHDNGNHRSDDPGQGTPKRPHLRRGHWHHYWKGTSGNKELLLHWVMPIFVNGDQSDDEDPARITPVK